MSTDGATTTSTNNNVDFVSNGFKIRNTGGDHNEDGQVDMTDAINIISEILEGES